MLAIACNDIFQLACSLLGILGAHCRPSSCPKELRKGLQGYNGAIAGLAFPALGVPPAIALPASLLCGYLSAVLLGLFKRRLPPLTAPVVLVLLCFTPLIQWSTSLEPLARAPHAASIGWLAAPLLGIGQIFFLQTPLASTLAVLALMLASPSGAILALAGSIIGTLCAALAGVDMAAVTAGHFGFNPALTALTLSLLFNRSWCIMAGGVLITVVADLTLVGLDTKLFTLPFILSVWVVTTLFGSRSILNGSPRIRLRQTLQRCNDQERLR